MEAADESKRLGGKTVNLNEIWDVAKNKANKYLKI
jgi:hypothetical protein